MLDLPTSRIAGLVRRVAWSLAPPGPTRYQELPDCEQDLWASLLEAWPDFDPARGTDCAFARLVLMRAARSIVRARHAHKRRSGPVLRFDGGSEPARESAEGDPECDRAALDSRIDVDTVRRRLPADLRALADLLETHTLAEAARALGVPRSSLQRTLARIRRHFEARGLNPNRSLLSESEAQNVRF